MRLLLIGAGRMGRTHLRALTAGTVQITAVVDPSAASRASAQELAPHVGVYGTIDEALAAEQIDGVLIAAPTTLHRSLVGECARRKLPILCEKPCGLTPADVEAAAAAARAAGVPLQIGYWRRFVPGLRRLRDALRDGRFGQLLMISSWQWDGQPPDPGFRQSSGGIVIDMAVHELDLIRWLTGEELTSASPATATGHDAANGDEDPDCAAAVLALSGGAVAMISLGRHFPHGDCVWVEVMGTRDHARVDVLWGQTADAVLLAALRAQAEEFARDARGEATGGAASAADAKRTLELAGQLSGPAD